MKRDFIAVLNKAEKEEEVKHIYMRHFNIPLSTKNNNDCRYKSIIFEFKYNKALAKKGQVLAGVIAQGLYYIHRVLYGLVHDTLPKYFIIADKNEAAILNTQDWKELYSSLGYDWRRAPSSPDCELVNAVEDFPIYKQIHVYDLNQESERFLFEQGLRRALEDQDTLLEGYVTLDNFEAIFEHWKTTIGADIGEKHLAKYFIADLQKNAAFDSDQGKLVFSKMGEEYLVRPEIYKWFWKQYHRPPTVSVMEGILARADRLDLMEKRRFTGEFYTPPTFARLGLDYIAQVLGPDWYKKYYVWDMACGTGNLEYDIPTYDNVFMSTIDKAEISYLKDNNLFPGASIFQYDYLNDDVLHVMMGADLLDDKLGWKMPRKLREALSDKSKKWVVLFNPPYGEATAGVASGSNKKGVSNTAIKSHMAGVDLGKAGNELFVQFLYRISKELPNAIMGIYAKLKYVNAQAFESFRENIFHPEYRAGFIFPASAFQGTKGQWPVSFLIWDLSRNTHIDKIVMDVYHYDKD